jgi:hypothetical protein
MGAVSLDSRVSLIVASLDLQLTRLLRQAIRSADIASGRGQPVTALGPAPTAPPPFGSTVRPPPEIEPRQQIEPAPRFEPRPVIGVCACASRDVNPSPPPPEAPREPEEPRLARSPIEPPWKQLPWENPAPIAPKVKVIVKPPDLQKTGTVFDLFA